MPRAEATGDKALCLQLSHPPWHEEGRGCHGLGRLGLRAPSLGLTQCSRLWRSCCYTVSSLRMKIGGGGRKEKDWQNQVRGRAKVGEVGWSCRVLWEWQPCRGGVRTSQHRPGLCECTCSHLPSWLEGRACRCVPAGSFQSTNSRGGV